MNAAFTDEEVAALRRAHAQVKAYRTLGRPVPGPVEALEREYQRWVKRSRRPAVPRRPAWQVVVDEIEAERARRREVLAEALAEDARERRASRAA